MRNSKRKAADSVATNVFEGCIAKRALALVDAPQVVLDVAGLGPVAALGCLFQNGRIMGPRICVTSILLATGSRSAPRLQHSQLQLWDDTETCQPFYKQRVHGRHSEPRHYR